MGFCHVCFWVVQGTQKGEWEWWGGKRRGAACDEEEGGEEGSRSRSREKGKVADSIVLYLLLCQHIEEGGMSAFERRVRGEGGRGKGKG